MIGRSSRSVEGLERELQAKRSRLEQEERAAEQERRLATSAGDDRLDQAAADMYGGRIDGAKYERIEADVTKKRAAHSTNASRHTRVAALVREEISTLEREIAERPFEEALEKLPELEKQHQAAATALAKSLSTACTSGMRVSKTREAIDAALAEAKRLCPEWRDLDVEITDEAEWPDGVDALVELLVGVTPTACRECGTPVRRTGGGRCDGGERRAESVRRHELDEKRAAARRVPGMVEAIIKGGLVVELKKRFDALTEDEQAAALAGAEAALGKVEKDTRAEFEHPDSAFEPTSMQADLAVSKRRTAIEERIGWLRDGKAGPDPVFPWTESNAVKPLDSRDRETRGLVPGGAL